MTHTGKASPMRTHDKHQVSYYHSAFSKGVCFKISFFTPVSLS